VSRSHSRIARRFTALAEQRRAGLVTFVTAGDPDAETSAAILSGLPRAGADLIELGMPFSDPMADGPAIQDASLRALKAGQTLAATLAMVQTFRHDDADTPVVLMGYYNPIYSYGTEKFVTDAAGAGVDGLIVVDLPPEEDEELRAPAAAAGIDLIRLTAPTSDAARLPVLMNGASGFVYYVSIAGITQDRRLQLLLIAFAFGAFLRHRTFFDRPDRLAGLAVEHEDKALLGRLDHDIALPLAGVDARQRRLRRIRADRSGRRCRRGSGPSPGSRSRCRRSGCRPTASAARTPPASRHRF